MTLKINVHDVGHGQAVHVFTPSGKTIVIDLGCSSTFSPLECLRGDTDTIDQLILTHPHGDHLAEIELIDSLGFRVRQLWRPKWIADSQIYKQNQSSQSDIISKYIDFQNIFNIPVPDTESMSNSEVNGGIEFEKFSTSLCDQSNINNHSCVTTFSHNGVGIIIPGDNETPSWDILSRNEKFKSKFKDNYIFLASHHGRGNGYHPDLFSNHQPLLCLVSDGRVQNTDARERYYNHAKGWEVKSRSKSEPKMRYCLTTRTDGHISLTIGKNPNGRTYFQAEID